MRDTLNIAYVLWVEDFAASMPLTDARQRVDDLLLDPDAAARREDQAAMRLLMGR